MSETLTHAPAAETTTWCGACGATGISGGGCVVCGAAVRGPDPDELRRAVVERRQMAGWVADASARLARLDQVIAALSVAVRAVPTPAPAPVVPAPQAPTPIPATVAPDAPAQMLVQPRVRRPLPSPRVVLTWTGAVLLALAAIAFAAWAWTAVGPNRPCSACCWPPPRPRPAWPTWCGVARR